MATTKKVAETHTLEPGAYLRLSQLATRPAVTPEQAKRNAELGKHPNRPRPARPGILPVTSMTIGRWVRSGVFPAPLTIGTTKVWLGAAISAYLAKGDNGRGAK